MNKSLKSILIIISLIFLFSANTVFAVIFPYQGGTGIKTYTIGDMLYASGTGTLDKIGIGGDNEVLTIDGTTIGWEAGGAGGAGGANTALSNLASVAINESLISDAADTDDLGSTTFEWQNLYLGDAGRLYFGLGQDISMYRVGAGNLSFDNADLVTTGTITGGGTYISYLENTGDTDMGTATLNAGEFSMIQGAVASDPTFSIIQTGNDTAINQTVGNLSITAVGGTITMNGAVGITSLSTTDVIQDLNIDWGTGANQVSALDLIITDTTDYFVGTETETALSELGRDIAYADSPMVVTGGLVEDGTNAGTFKITAVTALLRTTDSDIAPLKYVTLAEQDNQAITATSTTYFVHLNYNGGSPTISISETESTDERNIPIGKVMKDTSNNVHYIDGGFHLHDGTRRLHERASTLRALELASGSTIAYSGTNNFTMTSGIIFGGINLFALDSYDSATTTFIPVYRDGDSGWTEGSATNTIDFAHYDDDSGTLGSVGVAKYGTHWVYRHADDGDVYVVYGRGSYSLAEAEEEGEPTKPDHLTDFGFLVGKIVAPQAGGSFSTIQMITDFTFTGTAVADHNELGSLQGGTAGEYYHLTSAQSTIATQAATTDLSGYLSTTDWDIFYNKAAADQTMYIGTTAVNIDRTSATLNLAGIGTLGCGAITSSGAITATSYGGITEANLLDKSAAETITETWKWAKTESEIEYENWITYNFFAMSWNSDAGGEPRLYFEKHRGTKASEAAVENGDILGQIVWDGYDGDSTETACQIYGIVDGVVGDEDMPGKLEFWTRADGTGQSNAKRLTIGSDGFVTFEKRIIATEWIQGTNTNGYLELRGDNNATKDFKLYDSGILDLEGQSRARAYQDATNQTIPDESYTRVLLDAEDYDEQSEMDVRVFSGTADATEANKLHDADAGFDDDLATVTAWVWNTTDNTYSHVTAFIDSGELTLNDDIMADGESYKVYVSRFKATKAGYYQISSGATIITGGTPVYFAGAIYKNGTVVTKNYSVPVTGGRYCTVILSDIIYLAANDYIDLYIQQDSDGTADLQSTTDRTHFAIHKSS